MKNKILVMDQRHQSRTSDWLFLQEQEDDFLLGKLPNDLPDIREDEE